ncbi:sigma-70 family RNA polymerase sigma factor [Bilifractor porci]|jgi:RNA polymerase sporulation-specific sigma factor|uniref:RNA polymerase sigma factor SigS n=1 Tax=Bilifractor porci TaxID=2606636 RepID=A0A7X2P9U3_9FIRM|nr:sigma-70 family RNA polymerase sigma factor [Bilifractor porci]MST82446.1 sigma-70 family RNA polymerase sigma factor [Bilifractor porci]
MSDQISTRECGAREEADDNTLIRAYRNGDADAAEILMNRYKQMVRSTARELYLVGGDREDLLQEGMLGLFKAIRQYDPDREASFSTFAGMLVSRQMYTAIEASRRKKHQALNSSISLNELEEDQGDGALGTVESPETIYLEEENARTLQKQIEDSLSPLETKVFRLYLEGQDYGQIASALGKKPKSIDNALQRIRAKVRSVL